MPAPINIINEMTIRGVKNLPTISTTLLGRIVNKITIPKNITENITMFVFGMIGRIVISYVVAAVLGIANIGPIHKITAVFITRDGIFPTIPVIPEMLPLPFIMATIVINATPISATKKLRKPKNHSFPASIPKYGGKIKLPAPKNMANNANPIIKISLPAFFSFKEIPPL